MDKYLETFETWNKVAKLYEDKFMNLDLYDDTYDKFCELVPKKKSSILEIGCGPGNITKYLLTKRPDFQVLGTDISPNMIKLAKVNCPNAKFEIVDSRKIENINNTFDAIVCGFCLPYLSKLDVEKLIMDCKSLLKENGILYLSFVEGAKEKSGYIRGSSGDRTYFYYHTIENILQQLTMNNIEKQNLAHKNYLKKDNTQEIHTIIIAKKHQDS